MEKKYGHLLDDRNVKRWYENVARGSKITADVYLRGLGNFCATHNTSPQQLIQMNEREVFDFLLDVVTDMQNKKLAGSYITAVLKTVKSWLAFNDIEIKRRIKVEGAYDNPSLRDERVPSQEELKQIFLSGDLKSRVACVLVAHSGLRIKTVGDYSGNDGLRIRDFPELDIRDRVEFKKIPTMIRVRSRLSKNRREYFTFLSEEGCEYLKQYLELRMRQGEMLTGESAIVTPKTARKKFIRSINVGDAIRNAIRKAGFSWRPYVLRHYFDTQLMIAESKGLIIRDYRTFFMGHKGDIEHTYTLNKRKLPQNIVEEMRESYRKSQKYLQTIEMGRDEEDINKMFRKQFLLVAGFTPKEIKEEFFELSDEEFQKLAREKLVQEVTNNGAKQKLVGMNEIESHLKAGWEFVSVLPNSKAVLKHPTLS